LRYIETVVAEPDWGNVEISRGMRDFQGAISTVLSLIIVGTATGAYAVLVL
jgi:hypothetical protein